MTDLEKAEALLSECAKGSYMAWKDGDDCACLDGLFTPDELEAIALVMRDGIKKKEQR